MLIGKTKHILYIIIQASSDNNRISSFKKDEDKKKTNILVMCYGVSCFCLYAYTSSDLYKPPLYRSTPVSRVGIVGCLRAYLILYCNNFRVHQIRCYHPGSHLPFYEGGIVFYCVICNIGFWTVSRFYI